MKIDRVRFPAGAATVFLISLSDGTVYINDLKSFAHVGLGVRIPPQAPLWGCSLIGKTLVSKTIVRGSNPCIPAIIKNKTVKTVLLFLTKTIKYGIINYKVKEVKI